MNMNINNVLKSADTKFTPKRESMDDNIESFSKSFNKFLEKKRISDKDKLKDKLEEKSGNEERKTKDKPKELKEHLNINYLVQSYPEDKTLNSETFTESIEAMLGEEAFSIDSSMEGLDGELSDLDKETIEALLDMEVKDSTNLKDKSSNFNIEQAKANLSKALNKEGNSLEEKEIKNLEELEGIVLDEIEDLEVKGELFSKDKIVSKFEKSKENSYKTITASKETSSSEENGEKNLIPKVESLEESEGKSIDPLDIKEAKDIKNSGSLDKKNLETLGENTNVEEAKLSETNFLFDRIQSSILGLEEADDTLSTQNIQTIEDNMIKFMKVSKDGDTSVMRVKLYPEELGSIDISLKLDKGKLIADIVVASDSIKDMFLNSSSLLNKNLVEQNIPIKNINITVNDSFENLENPSGEAGSSGSKEGNKQGQNPRGNARNRLINSPMDNVRIDSINKANIGNEGLNILV